MLLKNLQNIYGHMQVFRVPSKIFCVPRLTHVPLIFHPCYMRLDQNINVFLKLTVKLQLSFCTFTHQFKYTSNIDFIETKKSYRSIG